MDDSSYVSYDEQSFIVNNDAHDEEFDYSTLFVNADTGRRYKFNLHDSIEGDLRIQLIEEIMDLGGQIIDTDIKADTVLVDKALLSFMKGKFEFSQKTYAELPSFIRKCRANKRYEHASITRYPMGGRRPADGTFVYVRTPFTDEDDEHLARFLAGAIPQKANGGRSGSQIYKQLESKREEYNDIFRWSIRHPWQSWRERYVKNQERFDRRIKDIVKKRPPPASGKGQYLLDRRVNKKQPVIIDGHGSGSSKAIVEEEEEEEARREEEEEDIEEEPRGRRQGRSSLSALPPPNFDTPEHGRQRERSQSLSIHNDYITDDDYMLPDDGGRPEIELGDVFPADQQIGDKGKQKLTPSSLQTRPTSSGSNNLPLNTQMTLVGTPTVPISTSTPRQMLSHARRAARKVASSPTANAENAHTAEFNSSPIPESSPIVDIVVKRNVPRLQAEVVISPTGNSSSGPIRNTRARSRARDQNIIQNPPVRAPSRTRGRRGVIPTAQDAPYRNTRARSTSIEPLLLPTTQRFRSNKQVITKPLSTSKRGRPRAVLSSVRESMNIDLEPVQENAEMEAENNVTRSSANVGMAGTINVSQEEELQVEGALDLHPEEDQSLRHSTRHKEEMDSDDDATEASLANRVKNNLLGNLLQVRSPMPSPAQRSVKSSQNIKPEAPGQALRKESVLPSQSHIQQQSKRRVRAPTVSDTGISTEVEESFPVRNTKARIVKDRMDEEAKRKPFNPAPGTRAAELALSQNRNHDRGVR